MKSWLLGFLVASGMMVSHLSHRVVDSHRHETHAEIDLVEMVPSGEALSWISLGFDTQISDWVWIQAVLQFGEDASPGQSPERVAWFENSMKASIALDPEWRTLYTYGGVMMKVLGDYEAATRILELAVERFPEDEYFPFSIGATHYLRGSETANPRLQLAFGIVLHSAKSPELRLAVPAMLQSLETRHSVMLAYMWMLHASQVEGAPDWYASSAHAFIVQKNEREVGIRFLSEQLKEETDPVLVERLTRQLNTEIHDLHSERLTGLAMEYESRIGRALESLTDLVQVGLLGRVPSDPFESGWVIDVDRTVRSRSVVEVLETRARNSERNILAFGL